MADFEVTTTAREVSVRYADASRLVSATLLPAMRDIGSHLHRVLVSEKLSNGGILQPRTGNLKRAVRSAANDSRATYLDGRDIVTRVWFDQAIAKYVRIQEEGGTIVPVRAKNLAIPLPAMQTGKGVARGTAREVISNPQAFGFWGTFTAKHVIFGRTRNHDEAPTPLFALKSSVTLPARAPLRSTLDSSRGWIAQRMDTAAGSIAQQLATGVTP
jgi:hypothetical protein